MSFFQEFKEFAVKGNAVDMAVGIIIGAAFNKIVNSLVSDIFMPPLGYLIGGVEFRHLQIVIREAGVNEAGAALPEVAIRYGAFINTLIEFVIVAFSVFVVVKVMNRVIKGRAAPAG
ncbi:MAG TPA: large-conductance mechanosensitive channel protein MscL [Gammaproteobacteria bacterium]